MNWQINVIDVNCLLWGREPESIDHLFFKCCYSKEMCCLLANWLQVADMPSRLSDWKHCMEYLAGCTAVKARVIVAGVTAVVAWLWKEKCQVAW